MNQENQNQLNGELACPPKPPYYAVIFTSVRTNIDDGYLEMANRMGELAGKQEGYLGHESAREVVGITVSYCRDPESVRKWKEHAEHTLAREKGRSDWYKWFRVRIAKVERDYTFERKPDSF